MTVKKKEKMMNVQKEKKNQIIRNDIVRFWEFDQWQY